MEGEHEKQIATKRRILSLALLDDAADGEARIVASVLRQLTVVLNC